MAFHGFQQPMRSFHSQPSHLQRLYDQSVTSPPPYSLLVSGFRAPWLPLISGAFQVHFSRDGLSSAIFLDIFHHQPFSLGRVCLAHSFHFLELWLRSHLVGEGGGPIPSLLNVLSTQGVLTGFCMNYCIYFVQGFLLSSSLVTASSPPTQVSCRAKLSVNGSLLSSDSTTEACVWQAFGKLLWSVNKHCAFLGTAAGSPFSRVPFSEAQMGAYLPALVCGVKALESL